MSVNQNFWPWLLIDQCDFFLQTGTVISNFLPEKDNHDGTDISKVASVLVQK